MKQNIFNKEAAKGIRLSPKFYGSKKLYKIRSLFDESTGNTIVMVDFNRATVYEAKDFYDYVIELLDENKSRIIVDMENVYFVDSVFFGTLIKLLKLADKKNGYIKLIVDYNSKPELLSISNFEGIFDIYPNLFEAMSKNQAS